MTDSDPKDRLEPIDEVEDEPKTKQGTVPPGVPKESENASAPASSEPKDLSEGTTTPQKKPYVKEVDTRKPEDVIGIVTRHRVILKAHFGKITLYEFDSIDCDGAAVVEAFPSIGLVSVLTGMQLVKHMKIPLIGAIASTSLPLSCAMMNEQPSHAARVYGDKRLVVFLCEFQLPPDVVHDVVDCIYDFARRHKSPMIYTLEGMPKQDKYELPSGEEVSFKISRGGGEDEQEEEEEEEEVQLVIDDSKLAELYKRQEEEAAKQKQQASGGEESGKAASPSPSLTRSGKKNLRNSKRSKGKGKKGEDIGEEEEESIAELAQRLYGDKIHYVTTDHSLAARLRKMGLIPVVDGLIPGVSGGILAKSIMTSQEVTAFLAPTSTVFPTASAAVEVLNVLDQLLPGVTIPTEDLEKMNATLEKTIKGLLQGLSVGPKSTSQPHHMMYI